MAPGSASAVPAAAWHRPCYPEGVDNGLYSGVASARANERRLEAITANLANLDTPAYKRVSTGTRAFQVPGGREADIETVAHATTDFTQGELQSSANPYHLALMGNGFFVVDGPDGQLYTRNGEFHVDQNGELLTNEGFPVAWETKSAPIDPTGEIVSVDASGQMRQGSLEIGQLSLASFGDPSSLEKLGGGYFLARRGNSERPTDAVVHQHYLERSNVSSVDELVGLIAVQRSFENAQNVMQLIDQSYERLTASR